MRPVKSLGHPALPTGQRIFHQLLRRFQNAHYLRPAARTHGILKFLNDLLIGDKRLLPPGIVGQISQMDQQRQHIILRIQITHIITKAARIDPHTTASEHTHNILP